MVELLTLSVGSTPRRLTTRLKAKRRKSGVPTMYIKGKKAHNLVDNPIEQYNKSSSAHLTLRGAAKAGRGWSFNVT